jgi:AcrR family transcriptional regulator
MARPSNPRRREATLARATDYVLEHGLANLSLRPLAAALGTSTRMLLYDFGSKEELIAAVLAEARRREAELLRAWVTEPDASEAETLAAIWSWIAAPEREPFLRLFFEVYVDSLGERGARAAVVEWIDFLATSWFPRGLDAATATLFVGVVRGLLLDRLATGDRARTDAAFERFIACAP